MSVGVGGGAGLRVGLADIEAAAGRIRGDIVRTPLLHAPELAERVGAAEVRLKCENMQRAGAFKARGALHYLSTLPAGVLEGGVTTYSSGNHAQAVALAARLKGVRAVVVMPTTAPAVKVEGARRLGAEVVFEGTTSLERRARCEAIAEAEGLHVVPPFDHPAIIAGQGTAALEIVEEFPEVEMVLAPIGGGGLFAGTCAAVRALRPDALLIGVEPEGGASMRAALDAGDLVTLESTASIADGLLPVRAGRLTFEHVRDLADDVVTVSDDAIREAARILITEHRTVVEFSGAATTAALTSGVVDARGRRVALLLSGGNIDPALLADLLREAPS
ncbi:MAG: threonine/serine dehydratase [Longimicrobiales bacterium]|nr:threonine/serine dehydratase [Longimicrobiales bacterium]